MKTLVLDLETSPNIAHTWGLFDQNVSLNQLLEPSRMICFSAKWLGDPQTLFWSEFEHGRPEMLDAVHDLLTDADVVVHYNGRRFDIPIINRDLLLAGYKPPAPYQQIDLLTVAKRYFRFVSNKLAYVSVALGLEGKAEHEGHDLWTKCLAGDADAWARMEAYNRQDVVLTEQLYQVLRPWISNHPNLRLFGNADGCPNCGGRLVKEGFSYTQMGRYQRLSCTACGAWHRDSKRLNGTGIRGVA